MSSNKLTYTGWIVNHKEGHDDLLTLEMCESKHYASSAPEAWKQFLKLAGGTREKWNKLGYIAEQIEITVRFKKK